MVGRIVQGVIQECCECEVADEPVVVSKARPMKASNGVEGKPSRLSALCLIGSILAKSLNGLRRGEADFKTLMSCEFFYH